ncbi:hypothetical protein HW555_010190 [Spodoptera exigua]|uniref:Uncharacterized protein n=1 Tax=Spodoptera exigua TaxID=7107 RepID=A0A835G7S4_SPOEX|nr:hypothetical protein HW555_010190 [Spodoptera exigua]
MIQTWKRAWTVSAVSSSLYSFSSLGTSARRLRASSNRLRTWSSRTLSTLRRAWFSMFEDWLAKTKHHCILTSIIN